MKPVFVALWWQVCWDVYILTMLQNAQMKHTEVHWTDKDRFKEVQFEVNWGMYTHSIQNMKKMRPETNTSILFSIQTGLIFKLGQLTMVQISQLRIQRPNCTHIQVPVWSIWPYLAQINHFISWKLTKCLNNNKNCAETVAFSKCGVYWDADTPQLVKTQMAKQQIASAHETQQSPPGNSI